MHPPLLPILADALESAGFPTGVGWHVRVRRVLETLPADCPEDQLRDALCAVTATSPDEQERFYAIFEKIPPEYQRRMGAYNLKPPAKKTAPPPGPNTGGKEARAPALENPRRRRARAARRSRLVAVLRANAHARHRRVHGADRSRAREHRRARQQCAARFRPARPGAFRGVF